MARVHTRVYEDGHLKLEGFPVADVSEHLARPGTVVWVDHCDPNEEDLAVLADELGLHELAIEDALGPHGRPKLDRYDTYLFLTAHAIRVDPRSGALQVTGIDAFVSDRWLVTVREDDAFPVEALTTRWDRSSDLATEGVSFLLHGLIDVVVDEYFDGIEAFDAFYDEVSEGIFSDHPLEPSQQRHWFEMRRALVRFHRTVVPMREAVSSLMRREHDVVTPVMYPYYQDVYDHLLRVAEATEGLRDLVASIVETNLSLRDYRQNQVMKKVSSWAAIIAVPTLVTGFYGMNVPFPGSQHGSGVWAATALMVLLSAALYGLFRWRDWL